MGLVTGGIFIVLGVFVLCVATFGIFRFEYALPYNLQRVEHGVGQNRIDSSVYLDWQPGGLPHGGQGRGQEQSKP